MLTTRTPLGLLLLIALSGCVSDHEKSRQAYREAQVIPTSIVPSTYDFLLQGGVSYEEMDDVRRGLPYGRIEFERTPCYGSCPSYAVVLNRDGSATYDGRAFVEREGLHRGEIDIFEFARLSLLIDRFRLGDMDPEYAANWTCDTTAIIRVHDADRVIAVSDYGRVGPIELWAIQMAIDAVVDRIEWDRAGSEHAS